MASFSSLWLHLQRVASLPRRLPAWPARADAALISAAFVALAAWSWGGWLDVLVDFGRELYVAWRISEGDVLYRDVASFYGPLSPYVSGLWFRLFGPSLRTLVLCNMAVLAATTAGLHALLRRTAGGQRLGATIGALVFLSVFGFAHLVSNGSFNFVCPYSHESTHGFALATAAVLCSLRLIETGRARWAAAAGLLDGLTFLTKPESFVAAAGASGAGLALALVRPGPRPAWQAVLPAFAGGLTLPPAVAFALLATAMPSAAAWNGVLGSWAFIGNEQLRGMWYFAWSVGLDEPWVGLSLLLRAAAGQLMALVAAIALAGAARARPRLAAPLSAAAVVAAFALLAPSWRARWWLQMGRPLPLWALAGICVAARMLWRSRREPEAFARQAARLLLCVFGLMLLPRMILNARLYHYGFVLAVPAVLLGVAALLDWLPRALDARGASGTVFRSAALSVLAIAVAFHLAESHAWLRNKQVVVGEGGDRFRADARGAYVSAALRGIAGLARPGDTLVVLPEGVMLNYLLRMRSSIPYLTMLPSDVAAFGEDELLGALQRDPPALVALVHRDSSEFGPRFFGRDYGQRILEWVVRRYVPAGGAGDPPLRPGSVFGVRAMRLAGGGADGLRRSSP